MAKQKIQKTIKTIIPFIVLILSGGELITIAFGFYNMIEAMIITLIMGILITIYYILEALEE